MRYTYTIRTWPTRMVVSVAVHAGCMMVSPWIATRPEHGDCMPHAGNHVLGKCPRWLIFVEGVGYAPGAIDGDDEVTAAQEYT